MGLFIAGFIGGLRTIFGIAALALLIMPSGLNDQGHLLFALMIGAAVSGFIITKFSNFKNIIAQPQDGPAVLMSVFALVVLTQNPSQELIIEVILAAVAVASIFTGMTFYALGYWKLGRIVRFIPYPVIGGFLAGSGLLITLSALSVLTNHKISLLHFDLIFESFNREGSPLLLTGILITLLLIKVPRQFKSKLVFPLILIICSLLLNLYFMWEKIPLEELQRTGWVLTPKGNSGGENSIYFWFNIPMNAWLFILENALTFIAITIVSIVAFLLNLSGLEVATNSEFDFNKELKVAGIANMVGGALGGSVNFPALSASLLGQQMKVHSRWVGFITYGFIFLFLIIGPGVLEYVPKPILGALLLCMGVSLLDEWLIKGYKRFSKTDYLIILSIAIVMSTLGYLPGVGIGLLLCLSLFVWSYSQVEIITLELNDVEFRSNVDRLPVDIQILEQHGDEIKYLKIEGFLFFGSIYHVYERIQILINSGTKIFILDMSKVKAIDSSAFSVINKIAQYCEEKKCTVLISRLKLSLRDQINLIHPSQSYLNFFGDRDMCIEAAENILIKNYEVERGGSPKFIWEDIFKDTSDKESIEKFKSFLTERNCKKGEFLIRQGDEGSELYIISSGKFDVFIQAEEDVHQLIRVRSMMAGSIFGESSLYSDLKRTASVRAEEDSTVFVLTKTSMAEMEKQFPRIANHLYRKMIGIMSERLNSLNRLISRLDP